MQGLNYLGQGTKRHLVPCTNNPVKKHCSKAFVALTEALMKGEAISCLVGVEFTS